MGDDRTRNPDESQGGRRESKTIRALRKRIRQFEQALAASNETSKILLDRTAEHAEQIESVTRLLYGKPEDPKDNGLKGIVEHQSWLWRTVPTIGGPLVTIATSALTAGLIYWIGWDK